MFNTKDHKTTLRGVTQHILPPKLSNESKKSICKRFGEILRILFLVGFYYVFSIGLTFYNKWMFKDFHYPLMTSSFHFLITFILAGIARAAFSKCRKETPTLEWDVYVKRVFVTGFASALDIGLSNWSFVFITVSLYTMVKSTAVIFILGFAILLGLEKFRCSLVIIVVLIATGLFLFVYESTQFNLEGFILVLSAAFIGGLRWTTSQMLLQKKEIGLSNPIDLMWHLQPTMFIGLFPLAVGLEGLHFLTTEHLFAASSFSLMLPTLSTILLGGLVAFFLGFSEYLLLSNTSSLTLSICGILKEICTLLLASKYNDDQLTALNWIGFAVCIMGIITHVIIKHRNRKESNEVNETIEMPLLQPNVDIISSSESEDDIFDVLQLNR